MKSNITLDRFDLKILHELQQNGGLSNQELAEKVGLTAAPCSRRVKQLEESGVIQQRVVRLDERALSLDLTAILHISMDKHIPERFETFEREISKMPEVLECYLITGHDADYQLKVAVPDMDRYHDILLGKITLFIFEIAHNPDHGGVVGTKLKFWDIGFPTFGFLGLLKPSPNPGIGSYPTSNSHLGDSGLLHRHFQFLHQNFQNGMLYRSTNIVDILCNEIRIFLGLFL